jgi:hypothetical protein
MEKIFPPFLFESQGAFAREAAEQGLDGFRFPVSAIGESIDDLVGCERAALPNDFHDDPFGIRDGRSRTGEEFRAVGSHILRV